MPFSSVLPKSGELGAYPHAPIPQLGVAAPKDINSPAFLGPTYWLPSKLRWCWEKTLRQS